MTLDQIETFIAVTECGSFKSASENLHRSQPALSVAVKKMEEELGIKLFSRDNYRPELTEQGRAFYVKAKEVFLSAKGLEKFGRQLGLGEEAEISLAIDGLCPMPPILETLRQFSHIHPDTRLNLSFEVLGGASEKVSKGLVQMAISPRVGLEGGSFISENYGSVVMIPVVSGYIEQQLKSSKNSNEVANKIKNIPQIIVRDSASENSKRTYGVLEGGRQWSVQDINTKKDIIVGGLGWGRLPLHLIKEHLDSGHLVELNLGSIKREEVDICLIKSEVFPLGPLARKLWDNFSDNHDGN